MATEENISRIHKYMKEVLTNYNEIRGKNVNSSPRIFWDAVVITASDASQKNGYEIQLAEKQNRAEIPLNVPFHVFADPPGYKIGCGGSTMFVLEKILKIYGNAMHEMCFLLIPAGGYSQRLPNLSVHGKLFCPLPFGDMNYQMLDLILATYLPFLKRMQPGVFLASSDAIISFCLSENDSWTFENEGFTALAHPSPLHIGTGHGVYVLPENENFRSGSTFMSECLCVLQKPTINEMHGKGAVFKNRVGGGETKDIVFSDSAFFFDHKISIKLINFYKRFQPLKCELSSYGDFLQPLGLSASPSYIADKVTSEDLASMRSVLYRNLYETKLSVLVLQNSNFHQLGSMKEYIDSLCFKNKFSEAFPMFRYSFSSFFIDSIAPLYVNGTILHSTVHPLSCIPECSVVEYSDFKVAVDVGNNCIISNVQISGVFVQRLPFQIPGNTLLHTVPLKNGYVTIGCGIKDDVKKTFKRKHALDIEFFGKKLKNFVSSVDMVFGTDCDNCSLWKAKLFPVCFTAEESFKQTLRIISHVHEDDLCHFQFIMNKEVSEWISMHDILSLKDTEKMINYHKELYQNILNKR